MTYKGGAQTCLSFSPCGRRWREAPDEGSKTLSENPLRPLTRPARRATLSRKGRGEDRTGVGGGNSNPPPLGEVAQRAGGGSAAPAVRPPSVAPRQRPQGGASSARSGLQRPCLKRTFQGGGRSGTAAWILPLKGEAAEGRRGESQSAHHTSPSGPPGHLPLWGRIWNSDAGPCDGRAGRQRAWNAPRPPRPPKQPEQNQRPETFSPPPIRRAKSPPILNPT